MPLLTHGRRAACLQLLCSILLAACAAPTPGPATLPAPTYPPVATLTRAVPTPIPATEAAPTGQTTASTGEQGFPSLAQALPLLDFTPLIPAYIPDQLPLARAAISKQGDLRLTYAFSNLSGETSPRTLTLTQAATGEPISAASIANPENGALDAVSAPVRGQEGFFFWTYAAGGRPSYRLAWREQNVNLTLALTGSWSGTRSADPHSLDPLLRMIASGLTFDSGSWQTVTTTGLSRPVTFALPPEWKPAGKDAFTGADGFARVEAHKGPEASLAQACEWEANAHPDWYGVQPEISLMDKNGAGDAVCLVRPDGGQAAVLIPDRPGARPGLHVLRVSARYALAVARSISLPPLPAAAEIPHAAKTPLPPAPSQRLEWQGLTVEIYRLGAASPDIFRTAPPEVLEKRRAVREQPAPAFDRAVVNGQPLTLQTASVQHPFAENGQVQVSAGGQVIYRYNLISPADARSARLFVWKDQWVININGMLVTGGEIANAQMGYDRIDGWTLLSGQPFYFAQKDGLVRVSYDGVLFPQVFDQLLDDYPHGSNERTAWFYALKDGQVLYIEMGRY